MISAKRAHKKLPQVGLKMPLHSNMISDMLGRSSYIRAKSWLALLAIGYLAFGAPLIHPFLHDHHGGPDDHGHQSGFVILSAELDAIEHDCLICHFLGQHHIVALNPPPTMMTHIPAGGCLSGKPVACNKSYAIPIIPRAPPSSLFFPIA